MNEHTKVKAAIDAHFAGRGQSADSKLFVEHLGQCQDCKDYYESHQLLAQLDPKALNAKQRIGLSLGISNVETKRPWFSKISFVTLASAAAAGALIFSLSGGDEFASRGSGDAKGAKVFVYQSSNGSQPEPVANHISKQGELAFAYTNPKSKKHLMIFGVDNTDRIYWFYPAWTKPDSDPKGIAIEHTAGVHELPDAIGHNYMGKELRIYALYTDKPVSVRTLEGKLSGAHAGNKTPNNPKGITLIKTVRIKQ